MRLDVGIGEMKVSGSAEDVIKTYALGSCVAVLAYDPDARVGGMVHVALPESKVNPDKARKTPGYFADTGLPKLVEEMRRKGANPKNIRIKLAGGASIMDEKKTFDIGRRNVVATKRFLWMNGLGVIKEDTGGKISRTVALHIRDGEVVLSNAKSQWNL